MSKLSTDASLAPNPYRYLLEAEVIREEIAVGLLPKYPSAKDIQKRNAMNKLSRMEEYLIALDPQMSSCFVDIKNWKPKRPGYHLVRVAYKGRGLESQIWVADRNRRNQHRINDGL